MAPEIPGPFFLSASAAKNKDKHFSLEELQKSHPRLRLTPSWHPQRHAELCCVLIRCTDAPLKFARNLARFYFLAPSP
jgi:hypothetical protein